MHINVNLRKENKDKLMRVYLQNHSYLSCILFCTTNVECKSHNPNRFTFKDNNVLHLGGPTEPLAYIRNCPRGAMSLITP